MFHEQSLTYSFPFQFLGLPPPGVLPRNMPPPPSFPPQGLLPPGMPHHPMNMPGGPRGGDRPNQVSSGGKKKNNIIYFFLDFKLNTKLIIFLLYLFFSLLC